MELSLVRFLFNNGSILWLLCPNFWITVSLLALVSVAAVITAAAISLSSCTCSGCGNLSDSLHAKSGFKNSFGLQVIWLACFRYFQTVLSSSCMTALIGTILILAVLLKDKNEQPRKLKTTTKPQTKTGKAFINSLDGFLLLICSTGFRIKIAF